MYKSEILKKAREQDKSLINVPDDELIESIAESHPDLEIEEDPQEAGLFDGGFSDFGKAVLKGADNYFADATNLTIGAITGEEYKPIGVNLGLREDDYGKGGIVRRTAQRGGEFFENTWEDAKANTRGEQGMAQNVYNMGGEALKFASGTFGDVIGSSIKTIAPDNLEKKVGDLVHEGLTETETGKWIAKTMTDFEKDMKFLKENDPAAYRKYRATFGYIEGGFDLVGLKKVNGLYRMGSGEIKHLPLDQVKKLTQEGVKKLSEASKKVKDIVKTRKEKTFGQVKNIIDSLPKPSKEYQKAVTKNGIEFEVEKTPTLFDDFNDLIFTKKNEELAVQSVFPKQTKEKGLNARLNAGQRALKGIEQLYDDRARGIVTANIHEMGGGVEGVQQGLEYWGKKIGELTDIDTTINFSKEVKELEKSLSEKFAKLNPEMFNRVKNIVDEFNNIGSEVTIKELQKGLSNIKSSVFSNFEVTKELASTSTGKALGKLLDTLTEKFNATIDIVSGNSKELMQAKAKYSNYLKIQKDLTDSFIVAQRNAGKGLSKQAGVIGGMYELLNNPNIGGVLKGLLLKKSGELISRAKSRDGNWEMLIRNLDRKAVKEYNIRKKYEGNKNMGDSNSDNTNIPNNMSNTNSDISTKSAVKEVFKDEEIIEFVQDVAKQIEESVGDIEALKDIKEGLKDFELPKKYKQILDEKIDTYIKDVENYMKEVDSDLDNYSLADIYGEDLTKSFNRLQGIEKRAKKTSGTDKLSTIEFETSPAYKSFSDKAQEYINENNLDLSVQELYEQMIDSKVGVKFQVKKTQELTPSERELIIDYTYSGGGTSKPMGITKQKQVSKIINKLPDNKDTVYSGLKLTNEQIEELQSGIFKLKRLLSASSEKNIAKEFMEYNPENLNKVLLTIEDGGKDISNISGFNGIGGEKEILFPIGTEFKVIENGYNDFTLKPIKGGRKTGINKYDDEIIQKYLDKSYDKLPHLKKPTLEEFKKRFETSDLQIQKRILSNLKEEAISKNLVALHNLNADKLEKIKDLGGMPGPSIAITKKGIPFEDFGDITLVGNKKLITSPKAKTYSADIYSPRVPEPTYILKKGKENYNKLVEIADKVGIDIYKLEDLIKRGDIENSSILEQYGLTKYKNDILDLFEKKLYNGTTNLGNAKYKEYTLDNLVKTMFKGGTQGNESGIFAGGLKNTLGKEAKSLNLNQIRKQKFTSKGELDSEYEKLNNEWDDILVKIANKSEKSFFDVKDNIDLEFSLNKHSDSIINELNKYGIKADKEDIIGLKKVLQNTLDLPKTYIETKIKRGVGLDEFNYILVPKKDYKKIKEILKGTKLENKIETYEGGEGARVKKIDEVGDKYGEYKFQKTEVLGQGEPITQEIAKKIVRKYFKPEQVGIEFVEKIVTPEGMEAFGKYRDKIITFAKNPIESTPEHEVLHAYFDMMMSPKKQAEILSEVKKTQKIKTNMEAEEWLADNFVEYVRKRKVTGIKGKLKQVIIDLARGLKDIFVENPDKIENMYKDLERLAKGDKRNIGKLFIVGNSIIQENNVEKE